MKLQDLIEILEGFAPPAYQEEYDNSGLLTGESSTEITGVLVTLDVNNQVLEEAGKRNCNLIVSHHPMVFKPMKKFTGNSPDQKFLIRAIRSGIAVYTMHTSIDNAAHGLNRHVAGKLGLTKCRVLQPREEFLGKLVTFCPESHAEAVRLALFNAGAGHIGQYDRCSFSAPGTGSFRPLDQANPFIGKLHELHFEQEHRIEVIYPVHLENKLIAALLKAHPYEEVAYDLYPLKNRWNGMGSGLIGEWDEAVEEETFLDRLRTVSEIPVIRHTRLTGKPVHRVALCTGSGAFLISDAVRAGADAFVTADLKYHDFFDWGERLLLADVGHYESEHHVKELIASVLIEKFPTFAILISDIGTNPVYYSK